MNKENRLAVRKSCLYDYFNLPPRAYRQHSCCSWMSQTVIRLCTLIMRAKIYFIKFCVIYNP